MSNDSSLRVIHDRRRLESLGSVACLAKSVHRNSICPVLAQ